MPSQLAQPTATSYGLVITGRLGSDLMTHLDAHGAEDINGGADRAVHGVQRPIRCSASRAAWGCPATVQGRGGRYHRAVNAKLQVCGRGRGSRDCAAIAQLTRHAVISHAKHPVWQMTNRPGKIRRKHTCYRPDPYWDTYTMLLRSTFVAAALTNRDYLSNRPGSRMLSFLLSFPAFGLAAVLSVAQVRLPIGSGRHSPAS